MYINLARMYPKDFALIEVSNYNDSSNNSEDLKNSKYRLSLMNELKSMSALPALAFDNAAYENAKCLAKEQGANGKIGHQRTNCNDGPFAECCSYGMHEAIDVVLQWLIDDKQVALGHRKICLGKRYTKIGASEHSHKVWNSCSIADFL